MPDGRAAVEPRRPAARRDAARDPGAAAPARHHHAVRHARPDRGHGHGRSGGAAARGPDRAGRAAGRAVRPSRHGVRRRVHRHAADEPVAARAGRGRAGGARHRRAGAGAAASRARLLAGIRPEALRLSAAGIPGHACSTPNISAPTRCWPARRARARGCWPACPAAPPSPMAPASASPPTRPISTCSTPPDGGWRSVPQHA